MACNGDTIRSKSEGESRCKSVPCKAKLSASEPQMTDWVSRRRLRSASESTTYRASSLSNFCEKYA